MKNLFFYDTGIGRIGIAENDSAITDLFFEKEKAPGNCVILETPLIKRAVTQLYEYIDGKRRTFDLPLAPKGTAFQQKVWEALLTIPYGHTLSYKQIAERIGNPKACRAVGMANNKNPISIIIPCHRVIGSDGSLVGYGGGLDMKVLLLNIEKENMEKEYVRQ